MLSSKQRAYLRGMAQELDTIFQIGKSGVTEEICIQLSNALEARELIKLKVLDNSAETPRSAAEALAEATGADVVCTVGTKLVLYRESKKKKTIII